MIWGIEANGCAWKWEKRESRGFYRIPMGISIPSAIGRKWDEIRANFCLLHGTRIRVKAP